MIDALRERARLELKKTGVKIALALAGCYGAYRLLSAMLRKVLTEQGVRDAAPLWFGVPSAW